MGSQGAGHKDLLSVDADHKALTTQEALSQSPLETVFEPEVLPNAQRPAEYVTHLTHEAGCRVRTL